MTLLSCISKMKKTMTIFSCFLTLTAATLAQQEELDTIKQLEEKTQALESDVKNLKKFKFSGYFQTQYQYGDKSASLKVGGGNTDADNEFSRYGIRRGRIKMEYSEGLATGVFQLDITEKGLGLKDAYVSVKDPWGSNSSFKAGVFNRPFGYEVSYSSSKRESPERATFITTLFPEERDLGAMLTLQAPKVSSLNFMKLEAAIISGNGIKFDVDNQKDFIGRLSASTTINEEYSISGGLSYYNGGVYQGTSSVFEMDGKSFVEYKDTANFKSYAKREYFGLDFQFETSTDFGMTKLYGEFAMGTQPGDKSSSKSPNYTTLPTNNTYIRNFNGYYITFVQDLGELPLSIVAKYDYYNPNTKVSKDDIGLNGTGKGDIAYSTIGAGIFWRMNSNLRLTAYYDIITNETSSNLTGYTEDIADNVFTLRLQYKL